jgi:hypothetical protein
LIVWGIPYNQIKNDLKVLIIQIEMHNLNLYFVCHFPPGTSKWNKVEHRLFSFISINWKGQPLTDYETIVNLIAATKTEKGLIVTGQLDQQIYEKGIQITDEQLQKINLKKDKFHGEWNYAIKNKMYDLI